MKSETSGASESAQGPGECLRQAREARGWSVTEVASQLNLTRQRLEQLEAGEFEKLPGHTFSRGYLRAYAKLLGIDSQALVSAFDAKIGSKEIASEVKSIGRIAEPTRVSQSILRGLSVLVLLGLAGVGFFWWQERAATTVVQASDEPQHIEVESADGTTQLHALNEPEDEAVAEAQVATQSPALAPESATTLAVDGQTESAAPPATSAAVAATPATVAEGQANAEAPVVPAPVTVTPAPEATAPVAAPVVAPSEPVVTPAAGEGVVEIQFSETCWVQVKDANQRILHSSIKRAGDSLRLVGKAPFEVRLGVARGAVVSYNGNQVDLAPFTSGETARMTLGQ